VDREVIVRLRNCIVAMANNRMMLFDTSVLYTFEASQKYSVSNKFVFDRSLISYYAAPIGD
jgi:exosome complex component RRP4